MMGLRAISAECRASDHDVCDGTTTAWECECRCHDDQ